jgi:hypothetical protein
MRLYLDTDPGIGTGWKGYDYRVVGGNQLQQYSQATWKEIKILPYNVSGNQLMIVIPKKDVDLVSSSFRLEFKWSDNMQNDKDPLDWYINGDVAPGGRFNYIYSTR